MDALELLKSDHQKLKSLFNQIRGTRDAKEKWRLFQHIQEELHTHTYVEESVLYPIFARYRETSELIESSRKEHDRVEDLVKDIAQNGPHEDFMSRMSTVVQETEAHIEKEEKELFPKIKKIMKRPERERIGRHIQAAKQEEPGKIAA